MDNRNILKGGEKMKEILEDTEMDWQEAEEQLEEDEKSRIRDMAETYGPDVAAGAAAAAMGLAPELALTYAAFEGGRYTAKGYETLKEKASDVYDEVQDNSGDYDIPGVTA